MATDSQMLDLLLDRLALKAKVLSEGEYLFVASYQRNFDARKTITIDQTEKLHRLYHQKKAEIWTLKQK